MEKLLSVIIPVYNGEKWVQRAVKSVVDQPCSNYIEIILINDGSTDDSAQVCEKIANENENVIVIHKENEGVSVARNTGIKNAKGKYLAFLDCDDLWAEKFFDDEILSELNDKRNFDMFSFSYLEKTKMYAVDDEVLIGQNYGEIPCNYFHHCSYMYNRKFLLDNQILYPAGIKVFEDMAFLEMCHFLCKKQRKINKLLYIYIQNPCSVTHSKSNIDKLYEYLDYTNEIKDFYRTFNIDHYTLILKYILWALPELCAKNNYKECHQFLKDNNLVKEFSKDNIDFMYKFLTKKQKQHLKQWVKTPFLFWLKFKIVVTSKNAIKKLYLKVNPKTSI